MFISKEVQARVTAKLVECIAILEKRYNRKFAMPSVLYTSATGVAGSAAYWNWTIKLSAPLLMDPANVDEMINETTPHELAHLVTHAVYPEVSDRGPMTMTRRGNFKRGKREVHGPHWQEVMRVMGREPNRCHTMKLSEESLHAGKVRERLRYDWLCTGCNTVIQLGPKHNRYQEQHGGVQHKTCRNAKLVKPGTVVAPKPEVQQVPRLTPQTPSQPNPRIVPRLTPTPQPVVPVVKQQTGSKMEICTNLFVANRNLSRAQLIAMFVSQASCTPAGAATYYQSLKKKFE